MSRSPRRKAVKALNLERKQVRRKGDEYRAQLLRESNAWMEMHRKELRDIRELLQPALERLVSVRIGLPFKVPYIRVTSPAALNRDLREAVGEVYTVETADLVRLCLDMPKELTLFLFNRDADTWRVAEREIGRAAEYLAHKLLEMAFTGTVPK